MKTTIKSTAVILITFIALFTSCKKDKDFVADLTLEKTAVEVFVNETVEVKISSGNNGYSVGSSAEAIATAEISGETVKISGKAKGTTTVTVKDGSGKTAVINVTVKNAIVDATTARFKWTNTVELETTNGWASGLLTDRISVTNLLDKKQFVLIWTGGYAVGDKSNAKLRIVERGKETQEIALTNLEIQSAENDLYSITFGNADQQGEAVVRK